MKRLTDIVISFIALLMLLPILAIVALLVRVNLGSPVLFTQVRPGIAAQAFKMYKFRSMTDEKDEQGNLLPDEARLTKFGKFLRASSLDELPELINVLKGEMSLVGPRPLLTSYVPLYSKKQYRRHEVRPGITGWAQINGRNHLNWDDRFELDVWYVDNQSWWLDWKIMILTIVKVFKREGISQHGQATREPFTGTTEKRGED